MNVAAALTCTPGQSKRNTSPAPYYLKYGSAPLQMQQNLTKYPTSSNTASTKLGKAMTV